MQRPRHYRHQPITPFPRMSLVNDLVIKGIEVGFASIITNAVAVKQVKKPTKKSAFFSFHRKRSRKHAPTDSTAQASAIVSAAATEIADLAKGLPDIVARGGPEGKKWVKLAICVGIDLVGSGSLGVPLIGDVLDLVTAPLTAVMLQALFADPFVTIAGLTEEILPGTDAIPTATLAWFAEHYGYLQSGDARGEDVA